MKKYLALILIFTLLFSGCGMPADDTVDTTTAPEETTAPDKDDVDTSYDASRAVKITLSGAAASASSDAARISGSTVTLTEAADYVISGTLDDGMIVVNAKKNDEVRIVLDGAHITNDTGAAIYVVKAGKVTITLEKGSENSLSGGDSFEQVDSNNINAVLYSKSDLVLNGEGTLKVSSPAGHGISSKDRLVITGGTYNITSASHAIDANDGISLDGAVFTLDAGKDGIHSENTDDASLGSVYISGGSFKIEAEGDGILASSTLQIEGGSFDIVTGGGSVNGDKKTSDSFGGFGGRPGGDKRPPQGNKPSNTRQTTNENTAESESIKAFKAGSELVVSGGTFKIDSADDALHSNGDLSVNNGVFEIKTGDDGFHADQTLSVGGGVINISKSYEAFEGLHVKISGGEISAVASDDGINAAGGNDESGFGGVRGDNFGGKGGFGGNSNGSIVISGGNLYIEASGDGIDANGTLEITGGHTVVCGPTQGDTSTLDYDKSAAITGGTFIGTGSTMMAQSFTTSKQGVIAVNTGNQSAKTKITLTDKDGNELLTHTPALSFARVVISSPDLISGESYTLKIGSKTTTVKAK